MMELKRVLGLSFCLLAGSLSAPSAFAADCHTSYFCYGTSSPGASAPAPRPAVRPVNTPPRLASRTVRRAAPPHVVAAHPSVRSVTPRRTTSTSSSCQTSYRDMLSKADKVEQLAILEAKKKNRANSARLFRTAAKIRSDAKRMNCASSR